jgi:hypothetical protein
MAVFKRGTVVRDSFTRPDLTDGYVTGDVICNSTTAPVALTFAGCAEQKGGNGWIISAAIDISAYVAAGPSPELWLFTAAPTMDNDNAAFTPTDAEMLNRVAIIPFYTAYVGTATAGANGNQCFQEKNLALQFKCAAGSQALYGVIVNRNSYTPVAQCVWAVTLGIMWD